MKQLQRGGVGRRHAAVGVATLVALAACALGSCARRPDVSRPAAMVPGEREGAVRRGPAEADLAAVYQRMGLLVGRGDLSFVGGVAHFATATGDSTLVLLSLSMTNRALTFQREGDRYRAPYEVRLELRRGDALVRRIAADEMVRVATFRETARTDESVLFYQHLALPPASYTLSVAVRDANSGRSAAVEAPLVVPRLGPPRGGLSTPVVVYESESSERGSPDSGSPESASRNRLDTLPRLTARARATATFGTDALIGLYVEGYRVGDAPRLPLRVIARGERDAIVWSDTASIERRTGFYGGVVRVPVARLGIGVAMVDVVAPGSSGTPGSLGATDSARAAVFVSLGSDLPVSTFDEMLGYLRYYATPERLRALRETAPEARAAAWLAFLREADASGSPAEHDGLREYFARVRAANARFTEDGGPGWLTDRGMTYIVLGEPDGIADPTGQDASAKGRTQVWQYRTGELRLTFADQTGFGRWRLTPSSLAQVQQAMRRRMRR